MSCFGGHNEQIYLIEMLIDKLTLTPGKAKDVAGHPIVIKIRLLDFPLFEFTRSDADATRRDQDAMSFTMGKCCMFIKRPQDLVVGLRSSHMQVGVFRSGDTFPIAETALTLPGCLCDQIGMLGNEPDSQPKPFTVKGGFNLVDIGQNPSGTLYMELVVACLGRGFFAEHELHPKPAASAIATGKDKDKEREICVKRYVPAEFLREKLAKEAPREEMEVTPKKAKKVKEKKAKEGKKKKRKK